MEHNDHDDGPWRGVVRIPFVVQILAGIFDVGVRRIERVELAGDEGRGQCWRCTDGGCRRNGRVARRRGDRGLQLRERGLQGLGQRGVDIRCGDRGGRGSAGGE